MGYIHLADVRIRTDELVRRLLQFDPMLIAVDSRDDTFSFADYLARRVERHYPPISAMNDGMYGVVLVL